MAIVKFISDESCQLLIDMELVGEVNANSILKVKLDAGSYLVDIKDNNHNIEVYICGGSSDSGDVIGTLYVSEDCFNKISVGSEILIKDVGAYFEEFFMSYGGDINKVYMEVDE